MPQAPSRWSQHLLAILTCLFTTLITQPLLDFVDLANIVMLFLLTVAIIAVWLGQKPAITASLASIALFDFFFVPPRFSFAVNDAQYLITFAVMLMVALIIGHLTHGLRQSAIDASLREQETRALYALAQRLAGAVSAEQSIHEVQQFVSGPLGLRVLTPDHSEQLVPGNQCTLSMTEMMAARSVLCSGQAIMLDDEAPATLVLPLPGVTRARGVMLVNAELTLLRGQRALMEAVASLLATALDRLHFVEVAQQNRMQMLTERLRSSILGALSHDVRTPLTVLYGLADTLAQPQQHLPEASRQTAASIRDQAMRLNNMVNNLLDMARLQAGQVQLHKEWQPIEEVIGASIKLSGALFQGQEIKVDLAENLPLIEFDAVLLERVFCNLIENAAKYSPPDSTILISVSTEDEAAVIRVSNAGSGFPDDKLLQVFEPFERGNAHSSVGGVGMGLAICRAVIEAHGGQIAALNPDNGGACVRFTLPLGVPPRIEPESEELA
jgi:two-component system, OmpR family, sensor histidine kinase KdpD